MLRGSGCPPAAACATECCVRCHSVTPGGQPSKPTAMVSARSDPRRVMSIGGGPWSTAPPPGGAAGRPARGAPEEAALAVPLHRHAPAGQGPPARGRDAVPFRVAPPRRLERGGGGRGAGGAEEQEGGRGGGRGGRGKPAHLRLDAARRAQDKEGTMPEIEIAAPDGAG